MPFFVGPGSSPDGGLEMKSDRVGFPTATSDPGSAVLGDMYLQTVGAGATLRLYDGNEWRIFDTPRLTATGGTKSTFNGKTIHTFTSDGTFTVTAGGGNVEYVIVGGGGAGGAQGGGGGAGGYRPGSTLVSGNLTITVGDGATADSDRNNTPANGEPSSVNFPAGTITSAGGGGGGARFDTAGTGGSGGGNNGNHSPSNGSAGNTPPVSPPQGNTGGNGAGSPIEASGGGGGAGAVGGNASSNVGGAGGAGVLVPTTFRNPATTFDPGAQWYLAGGGGGSVSTSPTGTGGVGGDGGGGNANVTYNGNGSPGTTNTGGGGGAAPYQRTGGNGGPGLVLIAYPT